MEIALLILFYFILRVCIDTCVGSGSNGDTFKIGVLLPTFGGFMVILMVYWEINQLIRWLHRPERIIRHRNSTLDLQSRIILYLSSKDKN